MTAKELPALPMLATVFENGNFEDISLDSKSKLETISPKQFTYLTKKKHLNNSKVYSKENLITNSRTNLISGSSSTLNLSSLGVAIDSSINTKSIMRRVSNPNLAIETRNVFSSDSKNLTPSQRLKLRRAKINANESKLEAVNNGDFDLSDDELPEDMFVFNVPFSQPLSAINDKEKLIIYTQRQSSITTDSTRTSSIISITNSIDTISSYENEEAGEKVEEEKEDKRSFFTREQIPEDVIMTREEESIFDDCNKSLSTLTPSRTSSLNKNQFNLDDYQLSEDAKELTIEFNRSESIHVHEEARQRRSYLSSIKKEHSPRFVDHTVSVKSSSPSSTVPSPDKSKYVTITRPDWLPPKDDYEKLKHKREYENLIYQALKKEKKNEEKKLEVLSKRAKQKQKDYTYWSNIIMKDYQKQIQLTSTREMWWRGIPPNLRFSIWSLQIGNTLKISQTEVEKIFTEVDDLLVINKEYNNKTEFERNENFKRDPSISTKWILISKIDKDLLDTFPDMVVFQEPETYDSLRKLVLGFMIHHSMNVNYYFTGLTNLAALLFYNLRDLVRTFQCLVNLLERKLIKLLLTYKSISTMPELEQKIIKNDLLDFSTSFNKMFDRKLNRLSTHFKIIGLTNLELFSTLIPSIFSNVLNFNISCHLIDIFLFEGDHLLLRTLLGLLNKVSYKLFGNKEEIFKVIGDQNRRFLNMRNLDKGVYRYLDVGYDDEFIEGVRSILKK